MTVGIPNFDLTPVEESIKLLKESGVDYEFRTTVVKEFHQNDDFSAIGAWLKGAPKYFLQNFVDSGNLIGADLHPVSIQELRQFVEQCQPFFGSVALRGVENDQK